MEGHPLMLSIRWDGPTFCLLLWTLNVPFLLLHSALVRVRMVEFRQDCLQDWSQQNLEWDDFGWGSLRICGQDLTPDIQS